MILVHVLPAVREDGIGLIDIADLFGQLMDEVLDLLALVGEVAIAKVGNDNLGRNVRQESLRTGLRFGAPRTSGAKDDPSHFRFGVFVQQLEQRAATTDLNVVGVAAQTENVATCVIGEDNVSAEGERAV